MKPLLPLTRQWIDFGSWLFEQRVETLQGVDDIIEDVVGVLEAKGVIDGTYSAFCFSYQLRKCIPLTKTNLHAVTP